MTLGIFWIGQQTQFNNLDRAARHFTWIHILFLGNHFGNALFHEPAGDLHWPSLGVAPLLAQHFTARIIALRQLRSHAPLRFRKRSPQNESPARLSVEYSSPRRFMQLVRCSV